MTVEHIFERFEIDATAQALALQRASYVRMLESAWVGPSISWLSIVKAVLFASLGDQGPLVRKKIGLDKYCTTLIARGKPAYRETLGRSLDLHQKLYVYVMEITDPPNTPLWHELTHEIDHYLLQPVPYPHTVPAAYTRALLSIDILHYKNPSV